MALSPYSCLAGCKTTSVSCTAHLKYGSYTRLNETILVFDYNSKVKMLNKGVTDKENTLPIFFHSLKMTVEVRLEYYKF